MKKLTAIAAVALTLQACTATQWASFVKNSPAYIAAIENDVQTALAIASDIFNVVLPLLATADQTKAKADYAAAVQAVLHSESALNEAGLAENETSIAAAVTDLQKAANQLVAVVNEIRALVPKTTQIQSKQDDAYADLIREQRIINH